MVVLVQPMGRNCGVGGRQATKKTNRKAVKKTKKKATRKTKKKSAKKTKKKSAKKTKKKATNKIKKKSAAAKKTKKKSAVAKKKSAKKTKKRSVKKQLGQKLSTRPIIRLSREGQFHVGRVDKKRLGPSGSATLAYVGEQRLGVDGTWHRVIQTSNGVHRWVRMPASSQ
jgi:hypothetical protein